MADKSINQLSVSDGLTDDGLLVVYQNSETKSITGSLIKAFATQGVESALTAAKESGEFDGQDGQDGTDGVSPTITVTSITGGHRLTITDVNGTNTVDVMDGEGGSGGTGADGFSPTITVTEITGGHRLTITDVNETNIVDIMDGVDGTDGVSPTVTVTEIDGGNRLTITDANGTQTVDVMDGADGADGTGSGGVTSWNDLMDKPFYYDVYEDSYDFSALPDVYFDATLSVITGEAKLYRFYKFSDIALSYPQVLKTKFSQVTADGSSETDVVPTVENILFTTDGLTIFRIPFELVRYPHLTAESGDYDIDGVTVTVPENGIYVATTMNDDGTPDPFSLVTSASFFCNDVKTLDEMYLPEMANLPTVTTDDNGKILQVVDGAWAAVSITDGNTVAY